MMIGWSQHQYLTHPAAPLLYGVGPTIEKTIAGKRVLIRRDPAPELLYGEPRLVLAAFDVLTSATRVRSCTFSFATDDLDLAAFNAGDPVLRSRVGRVLQLTQALAFTGVPAEAQLPRMVTTHTHAEHLELNHVWPRAVIGGHGKILNFNPHSMRAGSKAAWEALRDFLNHRFGWADPFDPRRQQILVGPDYLEKPVAEAIREGFIFGPEHPEHMLVQRIRLQQRGAPDRAAVKRVVSETLTELGWGVLQRSATRLTVGPPGTRDGKGPRVVLRGDLVERRNAPDLSLEARIVQRQNELASAKGRLIRQWRKRAEENIRDYGKGAWPKPMDPEEEIEGILAGPGLALPRNHPEQGPHRRRKNRLPSVGLGRVADMLAARLEAVIDAINIRRHTARLSAMCEVVTPILRRTATLLEQRHDRDSRRKDADTSDGPNGTAQRAAGADARHPSGNSSGGADRRLDRRDEADQRGSGSDRRRAAADLRGIGGDHGRETVSGSAGAEAGRHPELVGRPDGWRRADWLRKARAAAERVFPREQLRYRFIRTPEDGEVLAAALAKETIHLRPVGLYLAAGQIDGDRLEALAEALGIPWDWSKDAGIEERTTPDDQTEEEFGPGW
jgi:hypothetical protein